MDNKLNEYLATEVMGFLYANDLDIGDSYYLDNENGDWYCLCEDWHPDTNLNQAIMCAEKWRKQDLLNRWWCINGFNNRTMYEWVENEEDGVSFSITDVEVDIDKFIMVGEIDKLPLAICEAIVSALGADNE